MKDINYDDPKLLDNILRFLNDADVAGEKSNPGQKLLKLGASAFKQVSRVANKAFVDGFLYNEKLAHEVVKSYANVPQVTQKLRPQHAKIMQIYDRLAHLKKSEGITWADGLDKGLLKRLGELDEEVVLEKPPQLKEMILEDVFLPEAPEEQIFEAEKGDIGDLPVDPAGVHYVFKRIEGLPVPDRKLLFHIHADEFGSSSTLEGSKAKAILPYVEDFLRKTEHGQKYPDLTEEIRRVIYIEDKKLDKKLQFDLLQKQMLDALQSKKPFLIEGGWIGEKAGHAIYYEIAPTADGKFNFRLFNTGEGIQSHASIIKNHKIKYQAFQEWKGIEGDRITSKFFIEALFELKTLQVIERTVVKTAFGEKDVYEGLKELLKPDEIVIEPAHAHLFMTPQRSGVCSWKSLLAFMRTHMTLNDYKRFKCDIKIQSLMDYVNAHPENVKAVDWRLIKKSHANLCQSIVKLHQKGLVGDAYIEGMQEDLNNISVWIRRNASSRYTRGLEPLPYRHQPISSALPEGVDATFSVPLIAQEPNQAGLAPRMQPWTDVRRQMWSLDVNNPATVSRSLEQIMVLGTKAFLNAEDEDLQKGLIDVVSHLSIDQNFWTRAIANDPQKGQALMIQLGHMAQLFAKSCFTVVQPEVIFPEKVYVMCKVLKILEIICTESQASWSSLDLVSLPIPKSYFLTMINESHASEWENIRRGEDGTYTRFFEYSVPHHRGGRTVMTLELDKDDVAFHLTVMNGHIKSDKLHNIQDLIRGEFPDVMKSIPNFQEMTSATQDAWLLISDRLPEWVQVLRDTTFYAHHLLKSTVGALEGLNRQTDLVPMYVVEEKDENPVIRITLRGVNNNLLKVPAVNAIKVNPVLRFESQYRKVNALQVEGLFQMAMGIGFYEKDITNSSSKDFKVDMADEEFREIARLFSFKSVKLIDTLEFFSKHPQKLKDMDYQTLFHVLIFKGLRSTNPVYTSEWGNWIARFVQQRYESFSEENEIQTAVFLLKVAHQLHPIFRNQPFFQNTIEKLKGLLNRGGIDEDLKPVILAELIAELGHQPHLNEEEMVLLLSGSVYLEDNQLQSKIPPDPYTQKECREALVMHADKLQRALKQGNPNQQLLHQVLKTLRPDVQGQLKWKIREIPGSFPIFETVNQVFTYFPLLSRLSSADAQVLLPSKIRQNPQFQELFPGIIKGMWIEGEKFAFLDQKGNETVVSQVDDLLEIMQKIEGQWLRYLPASTFLYEYKDAFGNAMIGSQLGSRYLTQHYGQWLSQDLEPDGSWRLYLIDPVQEKKMFQASVRHQSTKELQAEVKKVDPKLGYFKVQEVISLDEHLRLGAPTGLFGSFEDGAYIHEWYDEQGHLKKVELPRFGLSFRPSPDNEFCLNSEQFPGYVLKPDYSLKALGAHHHYMVLENPQNQRKVLLPQQDLISTNPKEVLAPEYELERSLAMTQLNPEKYIAFDLHNGEHLFSKSREVNLYLAQVLSAAQEYKRAAYYLMKFGKKLSRYTEAEERILQRMARIDKITGDISGNGTVLATYAEYLLCINAISHHLNIDFQNLAGLYERYLNHLANVTVFTLQPDEEIFILKNLLGGKFVPLFFNRLRELDPAAAAALQIPEALEQDRAARSEKLFVLPEISIYSDFTGKPYFGEHLTRPHLAMKQFFFHFYYIARNGSESEKKRLKASLAFVKTVDRGSYASMARFYETVLMHAPLFPAPITKELARNIGDEELKSWRLEVMALVEQLKDQPPIAEFKQEPKVVASDRIVKLQEKAIKEFVPELLKVEPLSKGAKRHFDEIEIDREPEVMGLSMILGSFGTEDPIQEREISRLAEDLTAYAKEKPPSKFALTGEGLNKVKRLLLANKEEDLQTIQALSDGLLTLANRPPQNSSEATLAKLKDWGKLRAVITIEDLSVCFALKDFSVLTERNPALDIDDLHQIAEMMGVYLLHATRHQQRTRCEETLTKLATCKAAERSDLVNQLADRLLATRCFDPEKDPAYLVFEFLENISLRPSQVEKLIVFLEGGDVNPVMEMIMGSGKSKVLLPLLGLLRANGKTLSMLVVPQQLFESVSQDTQSILQGFKHRLTALHFDRHTQFTLPRLEMILDQLKTVRDHPDCLIMTSKSIQCFIDKFIEAAVVHFQSGSKVENLTVELKCMQKILMLLSESGDPIFDEADTLLNILHEVSFSLGNNVPPNIHELQLLTGIFSLVYTDPKIKAMAKLESDPSADPNAPALTEENYQQSMKAYLTNRVIDLLSTMTFQSRPFQEKIRDYIRKLDPISKIQLVHYLTRNQNHLATSQAYFDRLDPDVQDMVAFAGEQISHLLPYTLTRICEEKYGLDEKSSSPLAIPYSASQTPSSGSQFSNPHITMNYTVQTYMKKGIPLRAVEMIVGQLQEKAMQENVSTGGKLSIKETEGGKAFAALKKDFDIPLFNHTKDQLAELTRRLNQNPEIKLYFVSQFILPLLDQLEFKISCNPQNLVAFFRKVSGTTGTLWNGVSMHHMLKPEPAMGTDSKTLTLLWKYSRSSAVEIKEGSVVSMLEQLERAGVQFDMISDAGGYFREGMNEQMAQKIAARRGKAVVFYNRLGEQAITKGEGSIPLSQSELKPEQRLTFLDQSHTTGADVPQKLDAQGIVTIGRNMLLRDLLQSVWRLRGLDKSQRVRFIVSEEVANIIRQKLTLENNHPIQFEEILKFVISNQAAQQGRDNYKALRSGFANIYQKILLNILMNEKLNPEAQAQAVRYLMHVWIKPTTQSARNLYGVLPREAPAEEVLKIDIENAIEKVNEIYKKMPWLEKAGISQQECLDEIHQIVQKIQEYLPDQLQLPSKEIDDDQTVEVERELKLETETETELEVEEVAQDAVTLIYQVRGNSLRPVEGFEEAKALLEGKRLELRTMKMKEFDFNYWPVFSLSSYLVTDPVLKKYAEAFENINIVMDVLEGTDQGYHLLGTKRTPFHHLMIDKDQITLLTQNEAEKYFGEPNYYNLTLGFKNPEMKLSPVAQYAVTKIKFLNGESQYSREELQYLKLWFKTKGIKEMRTLFEDHVLKGFPLKAAKYQNSSLQRVFNEMN